MMRRFTRLGRDQRGAAAVEFGLAIPIALTMVLGVMNFGLYLYVKNAVTMAVEETARSAILYPAPTDAQLTTTFNNALWTGTSFATAQLQKTPGTSADGRRYVDLVGTGNYKVNLVFVNLGTIPVRTTRRAYYQQ